MKKYCHVWFVRHGETDWNAQGMMQGHTDIPLNENGIQQAQQLNAFFSPVSFSAVFTSDLSRAKKTAEIIVYPKEIPIITHPILRERFMGPFEGKQGYEFEALYKEYFQTNDRLSKEQHLSYKCHPEVESLAEVFERVRKFLESVASKYIGNSILIVAHGGVIRSILDHFDFIPRNKWVVQNCGFVQLQADDNEILLSHMHGIKSHPIF